jgi:hypothetical protein
MDSFWDVMFNIFGNLLQFRFLYKKIIFIIIIFLHLL